MSEDCEIDDDYGYPAIHIAAEFDLSELLTWLETAQLRWGDGGRVTARLEGTRISIYQGGVYRAAIDLDAERPQLSFWADDDA